MAKIKFTWLNNCHTLLLSQIIISILDNLINKVKIPFTLFPEGHESKFPVQLWPEFTPKHVGTERSSTAKTSKCSVQSRFSHQRSKTQGAVSDSLFICKDYEYRLYFWNRWGVKNILGFCFIGCINLTVFIIIISCTGSLRSALEHRRYQYKIICKHDKALNYQSKLTHPVLSFMATEKRATSQVWYE